MKKPILMVILAAALLSGCKKEQSSEADPDHIYQEIWTSYSSDNHDTYCSIRFTENSRYTRVILKSPASVTINDLTPTLNEVGYWYEVSYDNEKVDTSTYKYTDPWKRVYVNTVSIEKSIELPTIDTLYKSKDNVITWIGDPCGGAPETITLHVGLILPSPVVTTSTAGATSLTLKAGSQGSSLGQGWTRVRIDRSRTDPIQQGTKMGGKIYKVYKSKVKWVYVI